VVKAGFSHSTILSSGSFLKLIEKRGTCSRSGWSSHDGKARQSCRLAVNRVDRFRLAGILYFFYQVNIPHPTLQDLPSPSCTFPIPFHLSILLNINTLLRTQIHPSHALPCRSGTTNRLRSNYQRTSLEATPLVPVAFVGSPVSVV